MSRRTRINAIQKFELPNGLRLLVKEDHRLPFVEFRAVFQGGVLAETPENNGITQCCSARCCSKARRRAARKKSRREIESVGGSIDSYGGNNSFGVNAEVLSSDFATGLDLLADVLLNPTFPADALEREREVQIAGIQARKDELLKSASLAMRRALFGDTGYGLDSLGTEETVTKLQPADLKAFHQKFAVPNNCVLAIFGDVKTGGSQSRRGKSFRNWKPGGERLATSQHPTSNIQPKRVEETRDKKQAVLVIGFPGTTMHSDDRYALDLLQEGCSDLGSRLFLRIREKLGLAYYVGAQNFAGLAPGYFAFYAGTEPAKAAQVETELLKEAELLRTEGLTAEELKRAKAKIIGYKPIESPHGLQWKVRGHVDLTQHLVHLV